MRHCHYCPSTELRSTHFHGLDLVLILAGIRRERCAYCGVRQWHWLLPRPLQWALVTLFAACLYVASVGPVDWLHQNGGLPEAAYARLNQWFYAPVNSLFDPQKADHCPATKAYLKYRGWWSGSRPPEPFSAAARDRDPFDDEYGRFDPPAP